MHTMHRAADVHRAALICLAGLLWPLTSATPAAAQAPLKADELRKKLGDLELAGPWFYDDLAGAEAEARKSGRPLLIVFRCVT